VAQDRHRRRGRVFRGQWPALRSLARIGERLLVRGVTERNGIHADANARRVHHLEHVAEATVLLADEFGAASTLLAERQHGVGRATPAHFVVQAGEPHVVGAGDPAVVIYAVARHGKERNASHAGWSAGHLREYEVDDRFSELVIAA
jgi:hypothetical protein